MRRSVMTRMHSSTVSLDEAEMTGLVMISLTRVSLEGRPVRISLREQSRSEITPLIFPPETTSNAPTFFSSICGTA